LLESISFTALTILCGLSGEQKIPVSLSQQAKFRNPDAIKGGTWEELDKILKKYGYETGLQKMDFAQKVSPHMDVENNQSRSFQVFRDGLRRMIS
jgi:hypothetical protein